MTAALRVLVIGGALSFRALFAWIAPSVYVSTMLIGPLLQMVFFTYLGRFTGEHSSDFYVVGNAVQVAAMAGVFGMTMGIVNERQFGTLAPVLATPANRPALFLGRALPNLVSGISVSAFCFAGAWLLLGFSPPLSAVPAIALVVAVTTTSCTALGLLVGAIGLRTRDAFMAASLVYFGMLLVCGVNVAQDQLPAWVAQLGDLLPVTHGIEAARGLAAGSSLGDVASLVWTEAAIGAAYAAVALVLLRRMERSSRRHATLELL